MTLGIYSTMENYAILLGHIETALMIRQTLRKDSTQSHDLRRKLWLTGCLLSGFCVSSYRNLSIVIFYTNVYSYFTVKYESGDGIMEEEKFSIIKKISELIHQADEKELKEYLELLKALIKNIT